MEYTISVFVPLLSVFLLTPLIISFSKKIDLVAYPSQNRWHSKKTPLLGGVSIFLGIIIGVFFSGIYVHIDPKIIIAVFMIFFSGLYDDIYGIMPYTKLLFQIIASALVMSADIIVGKGVLLPDFISIPLTILWIIGITNALNLLDNMDGLCTGTSAIISLFLGLLFYLEGQHYLCLLSIILSGATLGFLYYNFMPAKIFMGDCGSLTLGFLLSVISLMGTFHTKSHVMLSLGVPLLLMSIPIFDTTLVTISRKYLNRPVSQGGKDHLSHRLIALGYSERKSLLLMLFISGLGCLIALGFKYLDLSISLLFILLSLILFIGFGAMLSRVKVYNIKDYDSIRRSEKENITAIRTVLIYKRQIVELIVDSIIVIYSIYFSIWLQHNGNIPSQLLEHLFVIIQTVLPLSLFVFLLFRFYSTLWRYLTLSDAIRYLCAVVTVSFLIFILSKYYFGSILHYTTIIILFFVLFLLLSAFRLSERFISLIIRKSLFQISGAQSNGIRTIIVGAGDRGTMALKEILQNKNRDMIPIGFIDDDISKKGARIEGYKIFGDISNINDVVRSKDIAKIIIAIGNIEKDRFDFILNLCERTGKSVEVFSIEFNDWKGK